MRKEMAFELLEQHQLYVIGAVARYLHYHDKPETDVPRFIKLLLSLFDRGCWRGSLHHLHPRSGFGHNGGLLSSLNKTRPRWHEVLNRSHDRVLVMSFAFVAHVVEVTVWALLYMICGEFQEFGAAYYHSAVNYSMLGYGDVIMSPSWKLLGPLEAADGSLMFGVSTAMIFAVILRLIQIRFADLRD
jgi:hypothetical protein